MYIINNAFDTRARARTHTHTHTHARNKYIVYIFQ